jgi:protein gp37
MRSCNPNPKISEKFDGVLTPGGKWNGKIKLREDNLGLPLKIKKPTRFAIWNDLFHEDVSVGFTGKAFDIMELCPQHTFLILTKRPENMRWMLNTEGPVPMDIPLHFGRNSEPLKNIWLGVTAENQEQFDKRWHFLKQIPAAVKWISYEPALSPLILPNDFLVLGKRGWLVCGGESGHGARPMHPDYPRDIRDQCVSAEIPFFFKQWGEWAPWSQIGHRDWFRKRQLRIDGELFFRAGKKAIMNHQSGQRIEGQIWDQMPC